MLRPGGYREYRPSSDLEDIVECFWTSSAVRPFRVLPDGCMDIVFDFAMPPGRGTAVIGAMRQARLIDPVHRPDLLGVRFRPGGLTTCFRLEAAPVTDKRVDLSLIWPEARAIWNRLGEATPAARVAFLAAQLRILRRSSPDALVRHCVQRIEAAGGRLRMAVLENEANARQIERRFAAHVGLSPKRFARIIRFKNILAVAVRGPADWAQVAAAYGYADQPHLVREFKELSGLTPAAVGNLQDEP